MRKTIQIILGSALIAASTVQVAVAAERHHLRKVDRTTLSASPQFRNADDFLAPPIDSRWSSRCSHREQHPRRGANVLAWRSGREDREI